MNHLRKRKYMSKLIGYLIGICVVCSSCLRDDIPPCPPLQITLEVKDKNYFNIAEVERRGLAERVDENLPFREYVSTLFYALYDAETVAQNG